MAAKQFTLAEVAEHNTREDLYLVIRDEVYAVSKFVAEVSIDNLFHEESFWKFDLNFVTFWFLFASIQVKLRHCSGWSTVWRHGDLRDTCNYGCRVIRLLISLQFNRRGNLARNDNPLTFPFRSTNRWRGDSHRVRWQRRHV